MHALVTWLESHPGYVVAAVVAATGACAAAMVLRAVIRSRTQLRLARIAQGEKLESWKLSSGSAIAALGALLATGVGLNTNWHFVGDRLQITDKYERLMLFAVAETALLACALMARQSLRDSAKPPKDDQPGTPGTTGVAGKLVWVITAVASVSAVAESRDIYGAIFRIGFGPPAAAVLWHLAMGIEMRHGGRSTSANLVVLLAREARERLLSYLGITEGERKADQIRRDRAFGRAVELSVRLARLPKGSRRAVRTARRLQVELRTAGVARDPRLRELLRMELAVAQHADGLTRMRQPSPFAGEAAVAPAGSLLARVALPVVSPAAAAVGATGPVSVSGGAVALSGTTRQAVMSGSVPAVASRAVTARVSAGVGSASPVSCPTAVVAPTAATGAVSPTAASVSGAAPAVARQAAVGPLAASAGPSVGSAALVSGGPASTATSGATALAVQPAAAQAPSAPGTDPRLEQIRLWLQAEPGLTGAEAGRRLQETERTGQRLMKQVKGQARHLHAVHGPGPAVSP
ncbi:hypothetical protein OG618_37665 (plasmid) [Kitasatospora sp. NBC_01246]|uniref:hypothetical protein n=1 Tax=Kitasatospora sp. NBC_01246 TaxID=2903570 RepID=UPI002E33A954|nr:hypothetical protein [Kitasatospora sp. NBC_01246]